MDGIKEKAEPEERRAVRVFATTNWSMVLDAGRGESAGSEEALEELCRTYWPAIYAYARRAGQESERARDSTQEFFARLLAKGWLAAADQSKGRFRTFLLTLFKRFLADEHDHSRAQKRGGGAALLSLDALAAEEERPFEPDAGGRTPEQEFDRRWALVRMDRALVRLRDEAAEGGQRESFEALQGFLSGGSDSSLAEAGARLNLGASAVKMRLHRWRARYRELVRDEIARTVPRVADLDEEMRHLLAALTA